MLGTIELRCAGNIATTVGVVGHGETLAGVVDRDFLTSSLGDLYLRRAFEDSVIEGLYIGGHRRVENAELMRSLLINLGVAVAVKVLKHVDKVVLGGVLNVLEAHSVLLVRIKVAFADLNSRSLDIVSRSTGDFVVGSLRGCRSSDGIGELVSFDLDKVSVEDDLIAAVVEVIVLSGNVVDIKRSELRNDVHVFVDNGVSSHLGVGTADYPLLKFFAGHEWILRHGANGRARGAEVLGENLTGIVHSEGHLVLIGEVSGECEIGDNFLATHILGFVNEPTNEIAALDRRFLRQSQLITVVVSVRLVGFAVHLVGDGESVLGVLCPDVGITRNSNGVVKVAAAVNPLAAVSSLCGNSRWIIHAIVGVRVDRPGTYDIGLGVILVEGDSIANQSVLGIDFDIFTGDKGSVDWALTIGDSPILVCGTDIPLASVVLVVRNLGELSANSLALVYLNGLYRIGVPVIERDGPSLSLGPILTSARRSLSRSLLGL